MNIFVNKSAQSSYSDYFQNKIKETEDNSATRKPKATSSVTVSSYTDKEGNVHRTYSGQSTSVVDTMKAYADKAKDKDEVKVKKRLQYGYQKVSNQVLMAKNSMSASKAVIAATRSLADLKRKIKNSDCSEDEKEAALAHANRMIRIAKKKKKNLEMEELVKNSLKDEGAGGENTEFIEDEKQERKKFDISQLYSDAEDEQGMDFYSLLNEQGEELSLGEAGFVETNLAELGLEGYEQSYSSDMESEKLSDITDDLTEDLSEEIGELIGEAFQDIMDLVEVINPHMDEEHFEKLKMKHRQDEQKQLVKADTEYLKAYLKALQEGGGNACYNSSNSATYDMSSVALSINSQIVDTDTSLGFSAEV